MLEKILGRRINRDFLKLYYSERWGEIIPTLCEIAILNLYSSFHTLTFSREDFERILFELKRGSGDYDKLSRHQSSKNFINQYDISEYANMNNAGNWTNQKYQKPTSGNYRDTRHYIEEFKRNPEGYKNYQKSGFGKYSNQDDQNTPNSNNNYYSGNGSGSNNGFGGSNSSRRKNNYNSKLNQGHNVNNSYGEDPNSKRESNNNLADNYFKDEGDNNRMSGANDNQFSLPKDAELDNASEKTESVADYNMNFDEKNPDLINEGNEFFRKQKEYKRSVEEYQRKKTEREVEEMKDKDKKEENIIQSRIIERKVTKKTNSNKLNPEQFQTFKGQTSENEKLSDEEKYTQQELDLIKNEIKNNNVLKSN